MLTVRWATSPGNPGKRWQAISVLIRSASIRAPAGGASGRVTPTSPPPARAPVGDKPCQAVRDRHFPHVLVHFGQLQRKSRFIGERNDRTRRLPADLAGPGMAAYHEKRRRQKHIAPGALLPLLFDLTRLGTCAARH